MLEFVAFPWRSGWQGFLGDHRHTSTNDAIERGEHDVGPELAPEIVGPLMPGRAIFTRFAGALVDAAILPACKYIG